MKMPAFKIILARALFAVLILLASFWVWSQPYEIRPHISKLIICLAGAVLIGKGFLAVEAFSKQLMSIYRERFGFDADSIDPQTDQLTRRLYMAFVVLGIGIFLLNVAMSGAAA